MKWREIISCLGVKADIRNLIIVKCFVNLVTGKKRISIKMEDFGDMK